MHTAKTIAAMAALILPTINLSLNTVLAISYGHALPHWVNTLFAAAIVSAVSVSVQVHLYEQRDARREQSDQALTARLTALFKRVAGVEYDHGWADGWQARSNGAVTAIRHPIRRTGERN